MVEGRGGQLGRGHHARSVPTPPPPNTHTHTAHLPTTSAVKSGIGMAAQTSVSSGKAKVKCQHDIPICCHGNLEINLEANTRALEQDNHESRRFRKLRLCGRSSEERKKAQIKEPSLTAGPVGGVQGGPHRVFGPQNVRRVL